MTVGFINSKSVTLSSRFNNGGGNVLNYNKLHSASNGLAIWLSVFVGCFLSICAVSAEELPSESDFTSMRAVVLSKSSSVQEDRHDTTSFSVYYRSAVSRIERGFRNNAASLDAASEGLHSVVYNRNLRIYKVYIIGAASPEGRPGLNARLAHDRAEGVKTFLKSIEPRLTDADFIVISRGEDWEGATKIAESYDTENGSSAVSDIFKNSKGTETKKLMMKRLQGGNVWRKFISDYYPSLRRTDIHVLYSTVQPILPVECKWQDVTLAVPYSGDIAPKTRLAEVAEEPMETVEKAKKYYSVAVKTNLLYDMVTALNFELEFPLGDRLSLMFEDVFPWWKWGPNDKKYCFQVWSMGVEPRWWFKRDERRDYLTGHFAGVYGMSGKYDLQWDTKLCYQGEFWSAGLTYGYAMPVCKWMNMEFSVSAGYFRTDYRHYQPDPGYEHLYRDKYKVGTTQWFGPTKLKVSLVIPIGKDSHTVNK